MRKYVVKGTDLNKIIENVSKHFGVDINQIKHENKVSFGVLNIEQDSIEKLFVFDIIT